LIVLCGATATGKSGLAIALAQRLNSVILSADSRQVYREFDIGTAKPTIAEQQLVPHYLIDLCDPREAMTVADYQQQAEALIARQRAEGKGRKDGGSGRADRRTESGRAGEGEKAEGEQGLGIGDWGREEGGKREKSARSQEAENEGLNFIPHPSSLIPPLPLLVGGTGLYIRAIVKGLRIPRVSPQVDLRAQLETLGQSQCYPMLQQVDPAAAAKIHANDAVRTLRSLEVFYVTGLPMSQQQGENPPTYPILQIGLDCPDSDALRRRIAHRTGQMVDAGLVREVEYLCQKYGADLPLLNTLGYVEFKQYLTGDLSLAQATEQTILHTRQFAKRQRTWFRAVPEIEWFDADAPDLLEQVWQRVRSFL
jgi:tRNA dimethylallyltransferase